MADFDVYAPTLMRWEARMPKDIPANLTVSELFAIAKKGGWVKDKDDKGGATMVGVTLATFREYFGRDKDEADLRAITYSQWRLIMRAFWNRCKADDIESQSIAEVLADWCVTSGTWALKKAQTALGLKSDGIIGPKSLTVLNSPNREIIFNRIKTARAQYYVKLAYSVPTNKKFLNGWLNRSNSFTYKG